MNVSKLLLIGSVGIFMAVVMHGLYKDAQRERERQEVLKEIQEGRGKTHAELSPDSFVYRWTGTKELPDVQIGGKKVTKGLTWDDALPVLEKGQRVWMERLDPDVFVDIRSFDGRQYGFSFARSDGRPYRLTTIESGTYKPKQLK